MGLEQTDIRMSMFNLQNMVPTGHIHPYYYFLFIKKLYTYEDMKNNCAFIILVCLMIPDFF